jgi:hypothetical protein
MWIIEYCLNIETSVDWLELMVIDDKDMLPGCMHVLLEIWACINVINHSNDIWTSVVYSDQLIMNHCAQHRPTT